MESLSRRKKSAIGILAIFAIVIELKVAADVTRTPVWPVNKPSLSTPEPLPNAFTRAFVRKRVFDPNKGTVTYFDIARNGIAADMDVMFCHGDQVAEVSSDGELNLEQVIGLENDDGTGMCADKRVSPDDDFFAPLSMRGSSMNDLFTIPDPDISFDADRLYYL